MLDPFDYKEPSCALCGGREFYYPDQDAPDGSIPVPRIIEKLDALFDKNDMAEAGRLLEYWRSEAAALRDRRGELSMESELMGYYRKINDSEKGLRSVSRGLELVRGLNLSDSVSGATVLLNAATTLKAFGRAEEALPLYAETLEIYKEHLPEGDARFGGLFNNRALALADLGRIEEAEASYREALGVMAGVPDGEADMAVTWVNLAHLFEESGDEKKIGECLNAAYALLDTPSLPRNGYYAFVCSKCAPAFGYFGYFVMEEELNRRAKEIYDRA